jgi:hypothetical protein
VSVADLPMTPEQIARAVESIREWASTARAVALDPSRPAEARAAMCRDLERVSLAVFDMSDPKAKTAWLEECVERAILGVAWPKRPPKWKPSPDSIGIEPDHPLANAKVIVDGRELWLIGTESVAAAADEASAWFTGIVPSTTKRLTSKEGRTLLEAAIRAGLNVGGRPRARSKKVVSKSDALHALAVFLRLSVTEKAANIRAKRRVRVAKSTKQAHKRR